jgi:UDP-N-acetylmuramoyl-tripeptide--D-alanyl-D-alanine ligase
VPAIICGELMGMTTEEAILALKRYSLPPGRLNIIPGVNGSVILDSSYNSSPDSLKRALGVLKEVGGGKRKIAVLGAMNELGEKSKVLHEMIGEMIPECADLLVVLAGDAKYFAEMALAKGMGENQVLAFKTAVEACEYLKNKVDSSDLILVKGSQNNVRLEKFVKIMMANPEDAEKLLVRQGKVWEAKL